MSRLFLFFAMVLPFVHAAGQTTTPAITAEDLTTYIRYLASDELQGRAAGTEGNRMAAEYVAGKFAAWGLRPLGDSGGYFQNFEFVSSVRPGSANALTFSFDDGTRSTLVPDQDFRPLGFSADTTVTGPLVFAGYGISATEKNYDDYTDLDVEGKVLVVLRHSPDGTDAHSDFNRLSSLRNKTRTAREKGAAALIIVCGPADEPDDTVLKLTYDQSFASSGLPVVSMKRSALEPLLGRSGRNLAAMQDSINTGKKPICFALPGITVSLTSEVVKIKATTANVVGLLGGTDPARNAEAILVGAHLDHLGFGGEGSGSMQPDKNEVHNGADDNASGTAGLLELAEAFAANRTLVQRSIVFVAFSGEEIGTLGSGWYVNHPPFPLAATVAMLNMDMIGRMKENTLTLNGTGTSPVWEPLIKRLNTNSDGTERFTLKMVQDGYGPSDHAQFYGKDIPVLFFFTGIHEDYHKPSDDWEKINFPGEQRVAALAYDIALNLAQAPERPAFQKTQSPASMAGGGDGRGFSVSLGVIPDYAWTGEGMKIDGVRSNGPAEKAGMKGGDVVVSLAGKKVLNIYDYMGILGELKAGQEVVVEVQRGEERLSVKAIMTKRN